MRRIFPSTTRCWKTTRMTMDDELTKTLKYLRLSGLMAHWDEYLAVAQKQRFSHVRLLRYVLEEEFKIRSENFFFFQAEDGIRDYKVTGVQTYALPIFDVYVAILPQLHADDIRFIHLDLGSDSRHVRQCHDETAWLVLYAHNDVVAHAFRQIANNPIDRRGINGLVQNVLGVDELGAALIQL